jgi:hypothetical protein
VDSAEALLASFAADVRAVTGASDVDPGPTNSPPSESRNASLELPAALTVNPAPARSPRLPNASVPSGAIWPAVDGRLILHEATSAPLHARRGDGGAWVAGVGTGWRVHSASQACFATFDAARDAVLAWARAHALRLDLLSPGRCIVVADAGNEEWRLWQIVRVAPSLRGSLLDVACAGDPEALFRALASASRYLFDVMLNAKAGSLPVGFESIGLGEKGAQYVGLMPGPTATLERLAPANTPEVATTNLARELMGIIRRDFWDQSESMRAWVEHYRSHSLDEWGQRVLAALAAVN